MEGTIVDGEEVPSLSLSLSLKTIYLASEHILPFFAESTSVASLFRPIDPSPPLSGAFK